MIEDPFETDTDWLARHGALIREATESHLDEEWITRARDETTTGLPQLGGSRRDAHYWGRWLLTVASVIGRAYLQCMIQPVEDTLLGIRKGLQTAMRHPIIVALLTLVVLFAVGFAAARL